MPLNTARVDISAMPDLVRLAEEVARTGTPRLLERDRQPIAMLVPATQPSPRRTRKPSQADVDAALAAFGAWKGKIDGAQLT